MSGVLTSIFNFKHKVKLWGNGHGHCIFIRARAVGEISLAASYLEAGSGEGASVVPPSKIFQEKLLSHDFFGPTGGLGGRLWSPLNSERPCPVSPLVVSILIRAPASERKVRPPLAGQGFCHPGPNLSPNLPTNVIYKRPAHEDAYRLSVWRGKKDWPGAHFCTSVECGMWPVCSGSVNPPPTGLRERP